LRADLLLVPHHGSRGSSSAEFLAQVQPGIAVASVGAGNRFGFPRPEVVERYREAGARFLSTAEGGALSFRLGPTGLRVRGARRLQQPRYWRERPKTAAGYAIGDMAENR
jgi:competence protein ComEC